jgi:hypothetical protein
LAFKAASGAEMLMFCVAGNGGVSGDIAFLPTIRGKTKTTPPRVSIRGVDWEQTSH